jgi:hypothetical protein
VCPDCFEIIGHNKEIDHVCKEDNLKSAELIKKETKGCPKCGVRIFKISGCDQMWCTECKVAFSWNTGKIVVDGVIHNPHFYQYMQNNNTGGVGVGVGVAPRNPGDVLCGGLLSIHNLKFIQAHLTKASSVVSANMGEFAGLLISNAVIKNFPKQSYLYSGMLNVENMAPLKEKDSKIIFDNIKTILSKLSAPLNSISIDAEPVVSIEKNYDAMPFITSLVKMINNELKLPVSVYISPAKFANQMTQQSTYNNFVSALRGNSENYILFPAYTEPDNVLDRDIIKSVSMMKDLKMKYKLILALRGDYKGTDKRMKFIKDNNLIGPNGVCLYSLAQYFPSFPTTNYETFLNLFYN